MFSFKSFLIGILGLGLLLSSCGQETTKEIISNWPNGDVQKIYYYKQKGEIRVKVAEETFYENGQQEMRGEFKNDKRDGTWTYWHENGNLWTSSAYENDLRKGKSTVWLESGIKNFDAEYSKGKRHGKWIFYAPDGTKNKDVYFEDGEFIKEEKYREGIPFNPNIQDSVKVKVN